MTLKLDLPIKQIINEYINGMTTVEIAEKYNCSYITINNRLRDNNIHIRTRKEINTIELPIEQIIIEYQNGINSVKLGKKYNCNNITITNRLRENNIHIRTPDEIGNIILPMKQISEEYQNGMSQLELSKKYNCSKDTINKNLKKNNIQIRPPCESSNIISTCICMKCGHKYEGKPSSQLCPDCNESGYCYKWNEDCKEQNREKYNNECFFCGMNKEENGRKLNVHHTDYNKNQGCDKTPEWKLIPLCNKCHGITNGGIENRLIWEARILYLHKEYWDS